MDACGQQYLLIEKAGNPKTERVQVYDEITFQLKNENIWYHRQILGLNTDAQLIQLGDDWLPISDITRMQLKRQRTWVRIISTALVSGGASMFMGDAWYTVVRNEHRLTEGGMEFGLLNMAVGAGLYALLGPIKFKIGQEAKHHLRIVDLTF